MPMLVTKCYLLAAAALPLLPFVRVFLFLFPPLTILGFAGWLFLVPDAFLGLFLVFVPRALLRLGADVCLVDAFCLRLFSAPEFSHNCSNASSLGRK